MSAGFLRGCIVIIKNPAACNIGFCEGRSDAPTYVHDLYAADLAAALTGVQNSACARRQVVKRFRDDVRLGPKCKSNLLPRLQLSSRVPCGSRNDSPTCRGFWARLPRNAIVGIDVHRLVYWPLFLGLFLAGFILEYKHASKTALDVDWWLGSITGQQSRHPLLVNGRAVAKTKPCTSSGVGLE